MLVFTAPAFLLPLRSAQSAVLKSPNFPRNLAPDLGQYTGEGLEMSSQQ